MQSPFVTNLKKNSRVFVLALYSRENNCFSHIFFYSNNLKIIHKFENLCINLYNQSQWKIYQMSNSSFCNWNSPNTLNPSQISSQQTLVLIYLPRKDGKLSWLRRERKSHKSVQISAEPGIELRTLWSEGNCANHAYPDGVKLNTLIRLTL